MHDYNIEQRENIQALIDSELKIYSSEFSRFVSIMKSNDDWAADFDIPKWVHSVTEQIADVEKYHLSCLSQNEKQAIGDKIFKEYEKEDFSYRLIIDQMLETFGL